MTIDRCLALLTPVYYHNHLSKPITISSVCCLFVWGAISAFYVLIEIPLDLEKIRSCWYTSCLLVEYKNLIPLDGKLILGILNIIASCLLFYALKSTSKQELKNRVVKVTMIMEIFLDVLPMFLNQLWFMISEISLGSYVGQLPTCLSMLNVAICSIYYSRILIRRQNTCCD
ncbi:hypothetical protein Ddc_12149 [Ditylenchus destructor]|nr:hypothetical protein Ddc_12149 [Ditylenchus destructor]